VVLLECGRLRGRDTWAARKEGASRRAAWRVWKAIGTVAYPLGDRRKAQVVGGQGGGGSGPGIPLGPGGALWESTPIQPTPQDCPNWFAHANGCGCPRQRLEFPFATLPSRKLAKANIHHGRCSERFCRSRGLSNPQDRPQRSLQPRAAIERGECDLRGYQGARSLRFKAAGGSWARANRPRPRNAQGAGSLVPYLMPRGAARDASAGR
jgi:hypothetical protein